MGGRGGHMGGGSPAPLPLLMIGGGGRLGGMPGSLRYTSDVPTPMEFGNNGGGVVVSTVTAPTNNKQEIQCKTRNPKT